MLLTKFTSQKETDLLCLIIIQKTIHMKFLKLTHHFSETDAKVYISSNYIIRFYHNTQFNCTDVIVQEPSSANAGKPTSTYSVKEDCETILKMLS